MTFFLQQLVNGVMLGSIYSLVAIGLTLIFGILFIPHFALGHKAMIAAYFTFFLVQLLHLNYWVATLGSMFLLAIIGILVWKLVFYPIRDAPHINGFISAFGTLMFLESLALILWGASFRQIPSPYGDRVISILGAMVTVQRALVVAAAVVTIIGLHFFLKRTLLGAAIRAVAQNREGAMLVGIRVDRISSITMAVGSALAALAGSLIGPISLVYPTMGNAVILKAFVVIILGGMGSVGGAILGGFLLGIVESLGGGYISTDYKDLFAFGALVTVLTIRPTGISGRAI
jgi:branched-chain amino acid transport system permease protein